MAKGPLNQGLTSATFPAHALAAAPRSAHEHTLRIQAARGWLNLDLKAVWEFRELLYFLVWRDVKVRYKQTVMGALWAILQPVLTTLIFLAIGTFANLASKGSPYAVFIFTALLPMNYFSQAITRSGGSLVNDSNLVRKVYFPRLIIPFAAVAAPLVDLFISFGVLAAMLAWFRYTLRWPVLTLPFFLLLAVATALGVGVWLSALNARYRDVGHVIPFLTQLWFFASPVFYSPTIFPEKWRVIYALNPMVGVIEGFRWALLGNQVPDFVPIAITVVAVATLLFTGVVFFKRMERTLADVL